MTASIPLYLATQFTPKPLDIERSSSCAQIAELEEGSTEAHASELSELVQQLEQRCDVSIAILLRQSLPRPCSFWG